MEIKISAIVIAKDEEKDIKACLEALSWVDETILVDTGSTDGTIEIAKKFGAKIITYSKGNFSDWRNEGLKHAKGDWVLYIDADERVTPELREEIKSVTQNRKSEISAYAIPRKNIILGREMKHGGWWPDYVKRLFLKKSLRKWRGELHEEPVIEGTLGHLKNPMIHLKHNNLSEMVLKTNDWSETEAKLMFEANHPPMNVPRFFSAMFREFWLRMVKNTGFLDGTEGIIYSLYQVFSRFISYAKLWEMQLKSQSKK